MQLFRNTIEKHEKAKKHNAGLYSRNQGRVSSTKTCDPYISQARSIIKEEVNKLEDLQEEKIKRQNVIAKTKAKTLRVNEATQKIVREGKETVNDIRRVRLQISEVQGEIADLSLSV